MHFLALDVGEFNRLVCWITILKTVCAPVGLNLHIKETYAVFPHPATPGVITKLIPMHMSPGVSQGASESPCGDHCGAQPVLLLGKSWDTELGGKLKSRSPQYCLHCDGPECIIQIFSSAFHGNSNILFITSSNATTHSSPLDKSHRSYRRTGT